MDEWIQQLLEEWALDPHMWDLEMALACLMYSLELIQPEGPDQLLTTTYKEATYVLGP